MARVKTAELDGQKSFSLAEAQLASAEKGPNALELFWVFVLASIIGLFGEVIVAYFTDGRWESRAGLIWGPFSPIYGLGAVLMTLCLWSLESHPVELFFGSALLGGAFEYVAGWFWETFYGIVAWSYADQPFNLGGHTSLLLAIIWGFAGLLWIRIGWPLVREGIRSVPRRPQVIITTLMAAFMALDIALTFLAFGCWFDRQAGLPVETPEQQFCATYFDDEFMSTRFETMSMWTSLAYNHLPE